MIEYGAQWVHGQGGNLVYAIAEKYKLFDINEATYEPTLVKPSESKVNEVLFNYTVPKCLLFFNDNEKTSSCNCSVQHYFEER